MPSSWYQRDPFRVTSMQVIDHMLALGTRRLAWAHANEYLRWSKLTGTVHGLELSVDIGWSSRFKSCVMRQTSCVMQERGRCGSGPAAGVRHGLGAHGRRAAGNRLLPRPIHRRGARLQAGVSHLAGAPLRCIADQRGSPLLQQPVCGLYAGYNEAVAAERVRPCSTSRA